jgi:hypothetical protein
MKKTALIIITTLLSLPSIMVMADADTSSFKRHTKTRSFISCKMAPNTFFYNRRKTIQDKARFMIKQIIECPPLSMGTFIKKMVQELSASVELRALVMPVLMDITHGYSDISVFKDVIQLYKNDLKSKSDGNADNAKVEMKDDNSKKAPVLEIIIDETSKAAKKEEDPKAQVAINKESKDLKIIEAAAQDIQKQEIIIEKTAANESTKEVAQKGVEIVSTIIKSDEKPATATKATISSKASALIRSIGDKMSAIITPRKPGDVPPVIKSSGNKEIETNGSMIKEDDKDSSALEHVSKPTSPANKKKRSPSKSLTKFSSIEPNEVPPVA